MYAYIHTYVHMCIYIYIYRERERYQAGKPCRTNKCRNTFIETLNDNILICLNSPIVGSGHTGFSRGGFSGADCPVQNWGRLLDFGGGVGRVTFLTSGWRISWRKSGGYVVGHKTLFKTRHQGMYGGNNIREFVT